MLFRSVAEERHSKSIVIRITSNSKVSTHFIFWRKGRESGSKPVLREIDFTVKPGETVAIVGPSGGGKTAIFSLIERFFPPTRARSGWVPCPSRNWI